MVPRDPPTVSLMQPTLVSTPFHREGWVYEDKYDGWRMVACKREDRVQLISRPGRDHTSRFPELVAAVSNSRCASRSRTPSRESGERRGSERADRRHLIGSRIDRKPFDVALLWADP